MSSNDPPIIRSNAPFKVEVSPGSLNAGGKRNGISPGEATGLKRDLAFDFKNDASPDEIFQGLDGQSAADEFQTGEQDSSSQASAAHQDLNRPENLLSLEDAFASLEHSVSVLVDTAEESNRKLNATPEHPDNSVKIDHEEFASHQLKLPNEPTDISLGQGIPSEGGTHDDKAKFDNDGIKDSEPVKILVKQGVASSVLIDVKNDQDNLAHLDNERSTSNTPKLDTTHVDPPNLQALDTETSLTNRQKLERASEEDNFQTLPEELHQDNLQQSMDVLHDHTPAPSVLALHAPLTEQVLAQLAEKAQGSQNIDKAQPEQSVQHKGTLESIEGTRAPQPNEDLVPNAPQVSAKRAQLLEVRNALMLEKQKKAQEYSGRLDAIRQSVAHVNARLDAVESTPKVVVE